MLAYSLNVVCKCVTERVCLNVKANECQPLACGQSRSLNFKNMEPCSDIAAWCKTM